MSKKLLSSKAPLFIKVKNILLDEIDSGELGPDGKLPSEEVLSQRYGVSRATIRSTLQSLDKDGIVTRQHGIGTFINSESLQLKLQIDEAKGFFSAH
jgi:GntR family transcriptional regulator